MSKVLTIENAEITTAAVELKTLTIKGRQVTLSLFRQLQEEDLIDENGKFTGNPWGFVNYQCKSSDERNIVWQNGKELRRFLFYNPKLNKKKIDQYENKIPNPWDFSEEYIDFLARLCISIICSGGFMSTVIDDVYGRSSLSLGFIDSDIHIKTIGYHELTRIGKKSIMSWSDYSNFINIARYGDIHPSCKDEYMRKCGLNAKDNDINMVKARKECKRLRKIHEECIKRWDEINALPQLFIAA